MGTFTLVTINGDQPRLAEEIENKPFVFEEPSSEKFGSSVEERNPEVVVGEKGGERKKKRGFTEKQVNKWIL